MKKLLFILISSFLVAQKIPEPNNINAISSAPIQIDEYEKLDNEFIESLRPLVATTKYGLGFIFYRPTGDEYSTGATFKIYNPSKKTIKYIWFTVGGENPVGDLVGSKGTYFKTVKGIGPVESNGIAEWDFQYLWFTNIVETLRIINIKIQYMDNTVKTLKYNEGMYIGMEAYEKSMTALYKRNQYEENINKRIVSRDDAKVYDDPDQLAEFPGGRSLFRNTVHDGIDLTGSTEQNRNILKTEVSFIIEKDGSLSEIKAEGENMWFNSEVIKSVKKIKSKWSSAKINFIPVRSKYKFTFALNND